MGVRELSPSQLTQLKQFMYCSAHEDEGVSYGELASIDELVTDEQVFDEYDDTEFVEDDFWGA